MNAIRRIALTVSLLSVLAAGSAALADRPVFYFAPGGGSGGNHSLTELGLTYQMAGYGYSGYRVQFCWIPSLARRIGFEPGDVILSINGQPLYYAGAHHAPLAQAAWNGGWFWFSVRDVRTGQIISRWANLNQ